ncbi:MAG TPA: COX15/CtaA family protein [Kiloniellales bacterium]|nr:COX15/CtaA family protein [Kiloniellales bacterium]
MTAAPRSVLIWLIAVAAMIFAMAVIGAITRLTESGLSIMEWAPFTGWIPPFSDAEWQRLYALYRTIPEAETEHAGITLSEFKQIFWWEWLHRVWGRTIGLVFLLPFLWFLWRRRLPDWLKTHGWILLGLGALQGAVGWFMVASGFTERDDVSQYRLVLHLGMALGIYAYLLWLIFRLAWPRPPLPAGDRPLRGGTIHVLALLIVALVSGGFVAGLNAGLTYNTYPLMDGELVPEGYAMLSPWIANLFENVAAVQFNHRLLTALTALGVIYLWIRSRQSDCRRPFDLLLLVVALQFGLGIATLLTAVPVWLGALHQAGAILLLTQLLAALYLLGHGRQAPARP